MNQIETTLYCLNKDSSIQEWKVFVEGNIIYVRYGKLGGKIQEKQTICQGKNIGRSNETSDSEQANLEAVSKWNAQYLKGYRESVEELIIDVTQVMLAQDASKKPHLINYPCCVSPKLDGCFSYSTEIHTNIGILPIGEIVNKKLQCKVLSWNEKECIFEYKNILNWFDNGIKPKEDWLYFNNNQYRSGYITKNHKVLSTDGWKAVNEATNILTVNKVFSGIVTGMLLGDSVAAFEKRRKLTSKMHQWRLMYSVSLADEDFGDKKSKLLDGLIFNKKSKISGYGRDIISFTSSVCSSIPYDISIFYNTERESNRYGTRKLRLLAEELSGVFTDESLSIWFFDDGSLHFNNGNEKTPRLFFSVARYSDETLHEFVKLFQKMYNVTPSIGWYGKDKRLTFDTPSSVYLLSRIAGCLGSLLPRKLPDYFDKSKILERVRSATYETINNREVTKNISDKFSRAYDIEVEHNHNYIANGRVVHNCRCLVTFEDNEKVVFNSRGNKTFPVPEHLKQQFTQLKQETGLDSFDGELIVFGMPLQKINSLVKKPQPESINLQFYIFDVPSTKTWIAGYTENEDVKTFTDCRYTDLYNNVGFSTRDTNKYPNLIVVPCDFCYSEQEVKDSIGLFMEQGYEGTIIRNFRGCYEYGQRSNDLLKWKLFCDTEAFVESCEEDKNGEGVLHCYLQDGTRFKCKMRGSHEERLYANQLTKIGKYITVKYQALTVDGVPQFPVGICERETLDWKPLE